MSCTRYTLSICELISCVLRPDMFESHDFSKQTSWSFHSSVLPPQEATGGPLNNFLNAGSARILHPHPACQGGALSLKYFSPFLVYSQFISVKNTCLCHMNRTTNLVLVLFVPLCFQLYCTSRFKMKRKAVLYQII